MFVRNCCVVLFAAIQNCTFHILTVVQRTETPSQARLRFVRRANFLTNRLVQTRKLSALQTNGWWFWKLTAASDVTRARNSTRFTTWKRPQKKFSTILAFLKLTIAAFSNQRFELGITLLSFAEGVQNQRPNSSCKNNQGHSLRSKLDHYVVWRIRFKTADIVTSRLLTAR